MNKSKDSIVAEDNSAESRYEISVDGELAGFVQYRAKPGLIALIHTEIDDRFEGQGLGRQLIALRPRRRPRPRPGRAPLLPLRQRLHPASPRVRRLGPGGPAPGDSISSRSGSHREIFGAMSKTRARLRQTGERAIRARRTRRRTMKFMLLQDYGGRRRERAADERVDAGGRSRPTSSSSRTSTRSCASAASWSTRRG